MRTFLATFFLSTLPLCAAPTIYRVTVGSDDAVATGGEPVGGMVGMTQNGDLRYCINQILNQQAQGPLNGSGEWEIHFDVASVTLKDDLSVLNLFSADTLSLNPGGSRVTINARDTNGNQHRGLFIRQGNVTLDNLAFENTRARGGDSDLGGGGAGMGGALFIDDAAVTCINCAFTDSTAKGGDSTGSGSRYGGGGFGGRGGGGAGGNGGFGGGGGAIIGIEGDGGSLPGYVFGGGGDGVGDGGGLTGGKGGIGFTSGGGGGGYLGGGGGGGNSGTGGAGGMDGGIKEAGDGGGAFGGGGGGGIGGADGTSSGGQGGTGGGEGGPGISGATGGGGGGGIGGGGGFFGGNGGIGGGGGGGRGGYGGGGGSDFGGSSGFGAGGADGSEGGFGGGGGGAVVGRGGNGGNGGIGGGGGRGGRGGGNGGNGGIGGSDGDPSGGGGGGAIGGAIFINTGSITFQGNTSFTGSMTQKGTGANDGIELGANDLFLMNTATVIFAPAAGETMTLAGSIADNSITSMPGTMPPSYRPQTDGNLAGSIIKRGAGTLVLEGTNALHSYSGTTTVEGGRLTVNGTIIPLSSGINPMVSVGTFLVQAGGTLGGTGTIHRPVAIQAGGFLSPGNSIGTLTVDFLTFNPTATLQVEINALGNASLVDVNGAATLGGTVSVLAQPGTYPATGHYTILEAGSLMGQFAGVTGPQRFSFSLSYPNNSVLLSYAFQQSINTTGLTGNPLVWANYLNTNGSNAQLALIEKSGNAGYALDRSLLHNTPRRVALDHLEPLLVLAFSGESSECRATVRTGQNEKCEEQELVTPYGSLLRQQREQTCCALRAEGFGGLFSQKGNSVAPGYDAAQGGAIVAFDSFGAWGSAGLLVSYARTHFKVHEHFGDGNFDTVVAAPYATFYWGRGYTEIGLLAGAVHAHQKRKIQFPGVDEVAKSSYWGSVVDPHLSLGYDFDVGDCCFIEPYLSLDWLALWNPSYSEHGSSFAMQVAKHQSSLLRSEVGLNFYQTWCGDDWSHSLRETVSYLNRKTFSLDKLTGSLPGSNAPVTFHYPNQDQNLGAWGLEYFLRHRTSGFFSSLRYDGEAGAKSLRNFLRLELGAYF